jgi:hypothetical protein
MSSVEGSDLAQNERVTAAIPTGAAQPGAKFPPRRWCSAKAKPGPMSRLTRTLLRTKVDISRPLDDGYFVNNIKAGDKVVTDGSGLLLAREINPSTEAGE